MGGYNIPHLVPCSGLSAHRVFICGFTTTGLALIQDIDHISNGINMWRLLLTFVGG